MNFYLMKHPEYKTDREDLMENPIEIIGEEYLPRVECQYCGEEWASSDRIFTSEIERKTINKYIKSHNISDCVTVEHWMSIKKEIKELVNEKVRITPGLYYGEVKAKLLRKTKNNFIHPFPGQIFIDKDVANLITENNLKGVNFQRVQFSNKGDDLPEYYEMNVNGKAWRKGYNFEKIVTCNVCEIFEFPNPKFLEIDENKWDGSDFFNIDLNPNIVVISEKAYCILQSKNFTNVKFELI